MKFKRITLDNAIKTDDVDVEECFFLRIVIGDKEYSLEDRGDDTLTVRINGSMSITPIANNCVQIKDN